MATYAWSDYSSWRDQVLKATYVRRGSLAFEDSGTRSKAAPKRLLTLPLLTRLTWILLPWKPDTPISTNSSEITTSFLTESLGLCDINRWMDVPLFQAVFLSWCFKFLNSSKEQLNLGCFCSNYPYLVFLLVLTVNKPRIEQTDPPFVVYKHFNILEFWHQFIWSPKCLTKFARMVSPTKCYSSFIRPLQKCQPAETMRNCQSGWLTWMVTFYLTCLPYLITPACLTWLHLDAIN